MYSWSDPAYCRDECHEAGISYSHRVKISYITKHHMRWAVCDLCEHLLWGFYIIDEEPELADA